MRFDPPTPEQLKSVFEGALQSMCNGGGLNMETGLDRETEKALWAISAAYPEVPETLVAAARAAFAAQLDGTNAAARRAAMERRLAGRTDRNQL